jgi:D-methionine transport system substrate-binding protein
MKKLLGLALGASVALVGCGQSEAPQQDAAKSGELQTITMASTGSDADVWRYIATLPETKAAGIKLEVKNFNDYVAMNTAVANKEIDVNTFQSYNYMVAYNTETTDKKVAAVSTTYIEPMGIYSDKYKKN